MNRQTGIWIDHRQAIVVSVGKDGEVTQRIESGIEKHVRFSGHAAGEEGSADNQRDRQYASHLQVYYDEVIAHLQGADRILLIGPGAAKGEFGKRLADKGLGANVVAVETADKMTDPQIAAKVRQYFLN